MKRLISGKACVAILILTIMSILALFSGCASNAEAVAAEEIDTIIIQDDSGREIEIPRDITRVVPSGKVATMILTSLAPDALVGVSENPDDVQSKYLPSEIASLPAFGQLYGGKSTLNIEALLQEEPQVIIDLGDMKPSVKDDMDALQNQTGIPALFFNGSLESMARTYRTLGKILGREERAESIAKFIDKTIEMAETNRRLIPEDERIRILYGTGPEGLAINANGSSQSQVIDFIGAKNAIITEDINHRGTGTLISIEALYEQEPDIIILTDDGPYDELMSNEWSELRAVKAGRYYEIPGQPYCWMSSPPSINMLLGVWWLGQLVYPEIYNDYDIVEVAKEYYELFWNYNLSSEEARALLANSYYK